MKFTVKSGALEKKAADCLIIGLFEEGQFTQAAEKIDKITKKALSSLLKKEKDFQGKLGQTQLLYRLPHLTASRVLLIGCGKKKPLNARDYRKIIAASTKALIATRVENAVSFLTELNVESHDLPWKIKQAVEASREAAYTFDQFKSEKNTQRSLKEITFVIDKIQPSIQTALKQGLAVANGVEFTKNLGNLPSNICTPTYLANQSKQLMKSNRKMTCKILDKKAIKKLGMGAFSSVAQGSAQDAKLVCITYRGTTQKKAPIVLVGKGVTFDTGGTNLKTADGMVGMKYDMCGAATILGVMKTVAELKLPLHIVGLLACVENMPGGSASKPEDIVRTLSGQTVEIMNTDAEGRLILCDTLTYAERFKPELVIDIATLTGAVVIALGTHVSALLANDQPLANALLAAGTQSHDRVWQLPLWEEYQQQINSPFADMANTGGRTAGVITSSCFLSRFTKKFHWAHLDVAGTAAIMGGTGERMATGRPVPLLTQYLINRAR